MATMTTTARLRYLRMSPRKVRLVIGLIRGMNAAAALTQLQFSTKQAARPVAKLLQSAMANAAHNHEMKPETLMVTQAVVDGGPILYRATPRAMGRSAPIRKRTAHITITLSGETKEQKAEPKAKKTKKKAVKDTAEKGTAPDTVEETKK
jgi:large subunit ribosomal protein L22